MVGFSPRPVTHFVWYWPSDKKPRMVRGFGHIRTLSSDLELADQGVLSFGQ